MNHFSKSGVPCFNVINSDFAKLVEQVDRAKAVPFFLWLQSLTQPTTMDNGSVCEATGIRDRETLAQLRHQFAKTGIGQFTLRRLGYTYRRNEPAFERIDGRKRTATPYFQFPRHLAHRDAMSWTAVLVYLYLVRRLSSKGGLSPVITVVLNSLAQELRLSPQQVSRAISELKISELKRAKLISVVGRRDKEITMLNPLTGGELKNLSEDDDDAIVESDDGGYVSLVFTKEICLNYWKVVLSELGEILPSEKEFTICCPFHADKHPSLSIKAREGVWICHAGCGKGGIVDFEEKLHQLHDHEGNGTSRRNALKRVAVKVGFRTRPVKFATTSIHSYRTADGRESYRFRRHDDVGKTGSFQTNLDGKWISGLKVPRLLYNLPDLPAADVVIIVEGEKKADKLKVASELEGWYVGAVGAVPKRSVHIAVTTTGSWNTWNDSAFVSHLRGKKVAIFHDTDDSGQAYRAAIEADLRNEKVEFKSVEFGAKDCRPMLERIGINRLLRLAIPEWIGETQ
jgi:hypothetical protein